MDTSELGMLLERMQSYIQGIIMTLVASRMCQCYRLTHRQNQVRTAALSRNQVPVHACRSLPDMTPIQFRLCKRFPDVTATAMEGVDGAIKECQSQFRNERWNCSNLKSPYSSRFLSSGLKEASFVQAATASGIVHQVSRWCSTGKLSTCGCDTKINFKHKEKQFKWKGCNHNIAYGVHFAKRFLNRKDLSRDIHFYTSQHNYKAGILAVSQHLVRHCKCHGMSGGCEVKTCWLAAPSQRDIGDRLKGKYRQAVKVSNTNTASGRFEPVTSGTMTTRHKQKLFKSNLVYFENSPSFCDSDSKIDHPGTQGRLCNRTSTGQDSCLSMCCGRGYDTFLQTTVNRCQCKFNWCCHVTCKLCTNREWKTKCK
ncbi:protein Wnt-10b-like isoform X2 [Lineus longissimus]|uniref:protein Wnt-10b-like isoform X2 n=1 Tax=Lineus longissimus TaxID=88925 RepID=UPI00315C64EE